jgi:hypothetical protein
MSKKIKYSYEITAYNSLVIMEDGIYLCEITTPDDSAIENSDYEDNAQRIIRALAKSIRAKVKEGKK